MHHEHSPNNLKNIVTQLSENIPAVKTFNRSMSLEDPSAMSDFSRVFMRSLEQQRHWAAEELSSVTV